MTLLEHSETDKRLLQQLLEKQDSLRKTRHEVLAELERLDAEVVEARNLYTAIRNKVVPACNLTTELLCFIFELAHSSSYLNASLTRSEPLVEVALSAVCKQWRRVATSMPTLWSTFHCIRPHPTAIQRELSRLKTYLERSGDWDLDLYFDFNELGSRYILGLDELMASTFDHISRWQRFVAISDGQDHAIATFYARLDGRSAPKLEYFDIRPSRFPKFNRADNLENARALPKGITAFPHYLRMDMRSAMSEFKPHYDHVAHIYLQTKVPNDDERRIGLSYSFLIAMLQLPSLETLSVSGPVFHTDQPQNIPKIVVEAKHLRHLRIDLAFDPNRLMTPLAIFMYQLSAPLLETMVMKNVQFDEVPRDYSSSQSATLPADYSFPSLRELHLIGIDGVPTSPNQFFRQLARRCLHVTQMTFYTSNLENVLRLMNTRNPDDTIQFAIPTLCPGTQTLALSVRSFRYAPERRMLVVEDSLASNHRLILEYWPSLSRLQLPSLDIDHILPESRRAYEEKGVHVDVLDRVGHTSWPPGYKWSSSNQEYDAFYKNNS